MVRMPVDTTNTRQIGANNKVMHTTKFMHTGAMLVHARDSRSFSGDGRTSGQQSRRQGQRETGRRRPTNLISK
eukprot:9645547-Alexandrium_andersonii.AAC.1